MGIMYSAVGFGRKLLPTGWMRLVLCHDLPWICFRIHENGVICGDCSHRPKAIAIIDGGCGGTAGRTLGAEMPGSMQWALAKEWFGHERVLQNAKNN
jgi:hypothetical protein